MRVVWASGKWVWGSAMMGRWGGGRKYGDRCPEIVELWAMIWKHSEVETFWNLWRCPNEDYKYSIWSLNSSSLVPGVAWLPGVRLSFIQLSCWPRQGMEITKPSRLLIAKTEGCSLQIDSRGPIGEDNTYVTHWTWRNWAGAHLELSSYILVSTKPLFYNLTCLQNMLGQWLPKTIVSSQQMSDLT